MERPGDTGPGDTADARTGDRNTGAYVGGADAVEKTSYAGDARGADVGARAESPGRVTAQVAHDRGLGVVGWVALVLALLALAAYAAGFFG